MNSCSLNSSSNRNYISPVVTKLYLRPPSYRSSCRIKSNPRYITCTCWLLCNRHWINYVSLITKIWCTNTELIYNERSCGWTTHNVAIVRYWWIPWDCKCISRKKASINLNCKSFSFGYSTSSICNWHQYRNRVASNIAGICLNTIVYFSIS